MKFNLRFAVKEDKFRVDCDEVDFHVSDTATVTVISKKDNKQSRDVILAIGKSEEQVKSEPSYDKAKNEFDFKFYNPFVTDEFNPEHAGSVIRIYAVKMHEIKRKEIHAILNAFLIQFSIDNFSISLDIPNYQEVPEEKQKEFERYLNESVYLKEISILQKSAV